MTTTVAPSRAELVGRAGDLVELSRKHAQWQEENRTLHEDVLRGIQDAGLLKMRIPARFGGYEADVRTVCDVVAELGRADGSVGWTIAALTLFSTTAGLFPDEVQDEIFADPDVRICGSVSPGGVAVPTEGGAILNGKWPFNTGAPFSQWDMHSVLMPNGDGGMVPGAVAVPVSDLTIIDDWNTSGLRGTSSVTVVAKDLFVPEKRVLPFTGAFRAERRLQASTVAASPALGMAKAALELFLERLPGRKISYTNYEHQIEAPLTHLQVAEAAVKIDEAEFHMRRAAERLDAKMLADEPWTLHERALTRMDGAAICLRAREAVDVLSTASGASSLYADVPIQRIQRDVQAINLNGLVHPNTNAETYGRILCGLEPNTNVM